MNYGGELSQLIHLAFLVNFLQDLLHFFSAEELFIVDFSGKLRPTLFLFLTERNDLDQRV